MLWYPLLAEFEHVRDIHYAAYQSLSLSLLKAAHSESVRAREGWVNAEPPTPKKHQSCREFLNISEGKNEDSQSEPKWQVEPWRTLVAVKSCSVGATNWHAAAHAAEGQAIDRAASGSVPFGFDADRRPREAWTRSNKIKQDQEKSRLNSGFTTGMPVPEVNVPEIINELYFCVVWGSCTIPKLLFLPLEIFRRCKMFLQREIFIRPLFTVFFISNVCPHKKECIPTFTSFEKCWTASLWAFLG